VSVVTEEGVGHRPVLVSHHIWNDSKKVHEALMNNRFDDILTVSDEAFMLVVMDNYIDPWHEKMLLQKDKEERVSTINVYYTSWL